jgi:hypothetical protein
VTAGSRFGNDPGSAGRERRRRHYGDPVRPRPRSWLPALLLAGCLAACGGDADGPAGAQPDAPSEAQSSAPPASSSAPAAEELPIGKSDLPLAAGTWASPPGFEPALVLDVPAGWTSVHRGSDGFDLGRPDPRRDAPLVAVLLLTPDAPSARAALADIRSGADGDVRPIRGEVAGAPGTGLAISGGSGSLVSSAYFGIEVDAAPGQEVRVLGADVGGTPLLAVVLVPDGDRLDDVLPQAERLLDGISPA